MGCHIATWGAGKPCLSEFGKNVFFLNYTRNVRERWKCFQACKNPKFTSLHKISETNTWSFSKDTHTQEHGIQIRGLNSEVKSKVIIAGVTGLENRLNFVGGFRREHL